jgi:hypothetical protein
MVTRAAEGDVPARIAAWCARPAEVATEVTRRPTGTAETPARVREGPTRATEVNAQVSTRPGPWPQGRRAFSAEARSEVPRRCAGATESGVEVGIGASGPAEVPTEVSGGSSGAAEVSVESAVGPSRPTIGCALHTVVSTWPTEITAQRGGWWLSGGVRSRCEPARPARLSRC